MNYKHLLIAILAGAALVGCNKEKGGENGGSEQIDNARYMGFTISMPSAVTKAADTGGTGSYVVGEDYENAIKSIHFFFYRNGTYVSWGYGDMKGKFTEKGQTSGEFGEILENTGSAQGVVVLESTMTIPNQVLCVINSRKPDWYRNKSLETVQNAIHSGTAESLTGNVTDSYKDFAFLDGDKPYFVMFTSPMYGTKAGLVSEKEVKYVNDIVVKETSPGSGKFTSESYIKNTRAEAEAMPITIFVERMAARFEIDNLKKVSETIRTGVTGILKDDGSNFVDPSKMDASLKDDSDNPLWDIEFLAWSVTAHNKKAYSIKHIDEKWFDSAQASIYGSWLQSGSTFDNPVLSGENMSTRINWAMDPNYSTAEYAFSNRNFYPHSARELIMVNPLSEQKYWSAKEVEANYTADSKSQGDILQRYSYENTFSKDGQSSPRVNGTMLLLYSKVKKAGATDYENLFSYLGQMLTSAEYAERLITTMNIHGYTFYIEDSGTYKPIHKAGSTGGALDDFTDPSKAYLKVVKSAKILDFYSKSDASYADKSGETVMVGTVEMPLLDVYPDMVVDLTGSLKAQTFEPKFAVTWPIPNTKVEKRYADGYVTLIPSDACPKLYVENPSYPSDPTAEQYVEATPAQIAEAFLNGVVEPANMYREGMMYYAIPIEHYGKAVDNPTDKKPLEGNYGVVRNNFYQVSIGNFKSLGHGIDDVDEPIVPGDRKTPYYLAAKINILSWQVATQTHDLEE